MKLYGYWRSSAAYRVRIALNLKGLECESIPVHLVKNGGEQHQDDYAQINPSHLVPTLIDDELTIGQSLAIIDYLDLKYPENSVYPKNLAMRAQAQMLALDVACDIHPLNNLRVQQYIARELDASDQEKHEWMDYWTHIGFKGIETKLKNCAGKYCVGNEVTIADICLIPQVYNAKRFSIDLSPYPEICKVVSACEKLPAFIKAAPENQLDAQ